MWIQHIAAWEAEGIPFAMVTILATEGATQLKPGAKQVVNRNGQTAGSTGFPSLDALGLDLARKAMQRQTCLTQRFTRAPQADLWLPGSNPTPPEGIAITLFAEPWALEPELVIFGASRVGHHLAKLCAALGWPFRMYDDRPGVLTPQAFPEAKALICAPFEEIPERIELSPASYCVIVTNGHKHDEQTLEQLLKQPQIPYLGMIGSPSKARVLIQNIQERGGVMDARVHCPIGLRIGRNHPPEVAFSILAEILFLARGGRLEHCRKDWNT